MNRVVTLNKLRKYVNSPFKPFFPSDKYKFLYPRNMNANTMQFLQEFKRYQELIRRPSIQRELIAERENLLAKISEYVQNERKSFSTNGAKWETKDFSKPVSNIYFVHHAEARFGDVIKTGELILSDLGNHIHKFSPFKPFLD